jgi:protein-S-isoprenylcysteine O-methyltransferase Ste14
VIVVFFWAGISLGFALNFLLPQAAIRSHRELLFFFGIALMLAGIAFRRYAVSVLGRFFTFEVAIHSGHTLIEVGPYRYIRHPSYAGALITQVGPGSR